MGSFSIDVNGEAYDTLATKSRKGVSLIEYLILHRGKPVSTQRLMRELWSERRSENPESAMKTMVSRTRNMLNQIHPGLGLSIASVQGAYRWEEMPGVTVDVLEIFRIFEELAQGPSFERRAVLTEQLLKVYKGDLYDTGDCLSGISQVNWFHREYLEAVYRYLEDLSKAEEYNRMSNVCRTALKVDDLDEQLHIELMRAMVNLNRASEAINEYKKMAKQTKRYFDAEPSEDIRSYYEEISKDNQTIQFNLDVIRNELAEKEGERFGPFFCDYRSFKEIYNIEMRNLERLGSTMFLGIIMIGGQGAKESSVSRESGMAGLMEILRKNLRKGDIVTRFSDNIVAMLLPTVNYSTGGMVMDRIEELFRKEYPTNLAFNTRISPLGGNPV